MAKIEVVETCPFCNSENIFQWDIDHDGYKAYCAHCGHRILLCSECMARQDSEGPTKCDWNMKTDTCFRCPNNYINNNN